MELLKVFQDDCETLNQIKFEPLEKEYLKSRVAQKLKLETIQVLQNALTNNKYLIRHDYKELCQLCLIMLGVPIKDYHFKLPGTHHHARWMSKAIYCLKMYMCRKQLKLSKEIIDGLRDTSIFICLIYTRAWIECPSSADAPFNDLKLFKDLHTFSAINEKVSLAAINKFENHLSNLGPELIHLCLFSNKVSIQEKSKL